MLNRHGRRIVVIELDGPIFFGSAETVASSVESELPAVDWIVLDLKYVGHFDSSGVMMLKRLDDKMLKLNKRLLLSYLPADGNQRRFLKTMGLTRPEIEGRVFDDTNAALSWCEDELLIELNYFQDTADEVVLKKFDVFRGLTNDEIHRLACMLTRQQHRCEMIIREGEECHSL